MRLIASLALDGLSYGMLLFLISVGLSVTLGLMRFINIAHGAFAMAGGYLSVVLMRSWGLDFLLTLPIAFVATALLGAVLERLLIRHVYDSRALEQVLFSLGLAFISIACATILFGPQQQPVRMPAYLLQRIRILDADITIYRVLLIGVGILIGTSLHLLFTRTLFGAKVRAAVDNRRAAEGLGIQIPLLFSLTFALGSGLAGLGGALSIEIVGLDPTFPLKFVTYFLIVVAIGGVGSISGSLLAGALLGIADVSVKYFFPAGGSFAIYAVLVIILLFYPAGIRGRAVR
jgi:branched-chain amino acid transport system permease protein